MANEIYADQLLHIIYRGAIEAVATAVEDVYRLGVRATDLETLIGEVDASPTANTIMDRLKSIITNTATIAADPATATLQTAGNASLTTIAGVDFATQTTLAAILAKIIAAPATEAKQDSIITLLTGIAVSNLTDEAVTADTDILASDYEADGNRMSHLMVMTDTAGILSLVVDSIAGALMEGQTLSADMWYSFDIPFVDGEGYNLQLSESATMQIKWVVR
jgi:hypothetical protein